MTLPAPPFIFRERTGQKRTVVLKARALPYRPIEFPITQRVEVSTPAGLQGGIATILGPTYGSTSFTGMWKDKYLGAFVSTLASESAAMTVNRAPVKFCVDADKLWSSIVEQGQELDIWWGPVYRRGILKSYKPKWHNIADMEWTLEVEWLSRGQTNISTLSGERRSPSDLGNSLLQSITAALRNFRRNFQFVRDYQERVLRTTQQMGALTEELNGVTEDLISANPLTLANSAGRNAVIAAGNIATRADAVVELLRGSHPLAQMQDYAAVVQSFGGALPNPAAAANIPVDRQLEATVESREQETRYRNMRNDARAYERARMTPDTDLLGTYRTREGEDLRDVSERYYGTPYEWRAIMEFNELTTSEVAAGTLLVIPRSIAGQEQGDRA